MKKILIFIALLVIGFTLVACDELGTDPVDDSITLLFDTKGGSEIDPITLADADLIKAPLFPTKKGYIFEGWHTNKDLNNPFEFELDYITGKTTLHAKWRKQNTNFNETFKVLSIGNSFSEDAHRYLWHIAQSYGILEENIIIANMYIGGADLIKHVSNITTDSASYSYQEYTSATINRTSNMKLSEAIKTQDWDVITFQQASHHSGLKEKYSDSVNKLYMWAKEESTNPDVMFGWHMTWAYEQTSTHSGFSNYENNQTTMYEHILSTMEDKVYTVNGLNFMIPSGTAIQNARTSYVGDKLTRDGYHLSDPLGRYIAGLSFFKTITGFETTKETVTYMPVDLAEHLLDVAFESVNNAYIKPTEVTQSLLTVAPPKEEIPVDGETLEFSYQQGFWGGGSTSVSPDTDSLHKSFIAVNPIDVALFPLGSEIVIEEGYQYRFIRLNKTETGYVVTSRSNNYNNEYKVVDEELLGDAQYIAFNISPVGGFVDIREIKDEVAGKLKLYHPKGTKDQHVNSDLTFELGLWELDNNTLSTSSFHVSSNPLDEGYFEYGEEIAIEDDYEFALVTLSFDKGIYTVLSVSDFQTSNLLLDETFWADKDLIAFVVKAVLIETDLTDVVLETSQMFKIIPNYIPHVDEELMFVSGFWANNATKILQEDTPFNNRFIASNVLSKEYLNDYEKITIDLNYIYRIIFLTYDGKGNYQVAERSDNLSVDTILDETTWMTYDYMAFNISANPAREIHLEIQQVSEMLQLELKVVPHIDTDLEFYSGFWGGGATAPTPGDTAFNRRYIRTNVLSKAALSNIEKITIDLDFQYKIIFLTYDNYGNYKVVHRTGDITTDTMVDETMWGEYEYIAFNIYAKPTRELDNDDLLNIGDKFKLQLKPVDHVDEPLRLV